MRIRMVLRRPVDRMQDAVLRARERGTTAGVVTAEYAMGIVAACGFAGLLITILRSPEVRAILLGIIKKALGV